jgi:hypothetical protein
MSYEHSPLSLVHRLFVRIAVLLFIFVLADSLFDSRPVKQNLSANTIQAHVP